MKYDKLIRDRIPEIIAQSGKTCLVETLSDSEYYDYLSRKLVEEAKEFLESRNTEELADLEEVLLAILEYKSVSFAELEEIRLKKAEDRGGFKKRLLLKQVD